jgi:uncharacterized membrane protein
MYHDPYVLSGWRIIFPIFGFTMMIFFMIMMVRRIIFWPDRRASWREGRWGKDSVSAEDILKRRYAEGEISREEYDRIKQDI